MPAPHIIAIRDQTGAVAFFADRRGLPAEPIYCSAKAEARDAPADEVCRLPAPPARPRREGEGRA